MPLTNLLDLPSERARLWPLSVEAYHALGEAGMIPERTELLYGFVFNKMPKSPIHSYLAERLRKLLELIVGSGFIVRTEQPITIDTSEPEPDVAVIRGTHEDFKFAHPKTAELVIEIAVSSEDYDREKAAAYASAGIPEFWIVLVPQKQIEIFSDPSGTSYRVHRVVNADQVAQSIAISGFGCTPDSLIGA